MYAYRNSAKILVTDLMGQMRICIHGADTLGVVFRKSRRQVLRARGPLSESTPKVMYWVSLM